MLGYAESEDGLSWRRPPQDVIALDGQQTSFVFDHPHGAAVLYDAEDPREHWRYKLLIRARRASLYALAVNTPGETPGYHRFREGNPQRNQVGQVDLSRNTPSRAV
jgi:hypothetical protein